MTDIDASLLDEIYAAPSDPARWVNVLAALCERCEAHAGGIYSPNLPGGPRAGLRGYVSHNIDVEYYAAHGQAYVLDDPFSEPMWNAVNGDWRRVAGALASEPGEAALRSDYYRVYLRGLDVGDTLAVMLRPPSPTRPTPVLALFRPWGGRPFDQGQIQKLQAVAPHLQRAAWIELDVRSTAPVRPSATLVVDQFPCPVLLLGADRRVAHANPAARRALAAPRSLISLADDRLRVRDPNAQARLDMAIDSAFGSDGAAGSSAEAILTPADSPPILGRVVPCPAGAPFVHEGGPIRAAILLIGRGRSLPGLKRFARLFGLSATEAEVAAALLNGDTPERIANDRGRSVDTVRSQVRGVITKTGVGRAAEIPTLRPFGEFEL